MENPKVREQFEAALDQFVENAKKDSQVIGIILYGSLAYAKVQERSDINVYIITKETKNKSARFTEYGIPISAYILTLDQLRRRAHGGGRVGTHQVLCRSKLLFSQDDAVTDFFNNLNKEISGQDQAVMQISYHAATVFDLEKAEKFLYTKNNLEHSFFFCVRALSELGYLLCYINGIYPPREVIMKSREMNSEYKAIYDGLINSKVTYKGVEETIRETYKFLEQYDLRVFKIILDYISENGGTATHSDIMDYFMPKGLFYAEFLYPHNRRIFRRTMAPFRMTKKGLIEYNQPQYHFSWDSFKEEEMVPVRVGPTDVDREIIQNDYKEAVENLVKKMEQDEYALTLIIAGSLSYDKVWEKSDVDAFIITRDDLYQRSRIVLEKDVTINCYIFTRDGFRKSIQRQTDGSIFHSAMSKSTVAFTRDETIYDLYEDIQNIGAKDLEDILLLNYIFARDLINKASKALFVDDEPEFSYGFIMSGIRRLAGIEALLNLKIPLREVVEQALELNPEFFNSIYTEVIHNPEKDKEALAYVLNKMLDYLFERLDTIAKPIIDFVKREDEVTQEDIQTRFGDIRLDIDLSDFVQAGILVETEAPIRFVKKSSSEMTQVAYHLVGKSDDLMIDIDM
ncbi:MAG: hypothetical protein ACTSQN_10095 [Candidatus Heimdallarchaeota archaeon]